MLYNPGTGPSDLSGVDPNSPDIFQRYIHVRLHGPSLWVGDPGAPTTVDFFGAITSFSLVPEPNGLALGVCGVLALLAIVRRQQSRMTG